MKISGELTDQSHQRLCVRQVSIRCNQVTASLEKYALEIHSIRNAHKSFDCIAQLPSYFEYRAFRKIKNCYKINGIHRKKCFETSLSLRHAEKPYFQNCFLSQREFSYWQREFSIKVCALRYQNIKIISLCHLNLIYAFTTKIALFREFRNAQLLFS